MSRYRLFSACCFLLFVVAAPATAEPFRYPEGKHGQGELKYINGLPVLRVAGKPADLGEQTATLALKSSDKLLGYPREFIKLLKLDLAWPVIVGTGKGLLPNFPEHHLAEMESGIKTGKLDRDLVVAANTMFDLKKVIGCSTLVVEPNRSVTGNMIFGRNLDFPTLGFLHEYSLVTVYKPEGKKAFASVGFPGCVGVLTGMNEDGLTLAVLEVYSSNDDSLKFDAKGTPYAICFRRLLEECATVEEAEKLLKSFKRTTRINLAICDKKTAAVFEITEERGSPASGQRRAALHQSFPQQGAGYRRQVLALPDPGEKPGGEGADRPRRGQAARRSEPGPANAAIDGLRASGTQAASGDRQAADFGAADENPGVGAAVEEVILCRSLSTGTSFVSVSWASDGRKRAVGSAGLLAVQTAGLRPPLAWNVAGSERPMTEQEWRNCDEPVLLVHLVVGRADPRQLRLFATGCCRRIWDVLFDVRAREIVEVATDFAYGHASSRQLAAAHHREREVLNYAPYHLTNSAVMWASYPNIAETAPNYPLRRVIDAVAHTAAAHATRMQDFRAEPWARHEAAERRELAVLLRKFIRHPDQTREHFPAAVVEMAAVARQGRDTCFALCDALLEAGNLDLAEHFRKPDHPQACWGFERILGTGVLQR